MKVNQRRFCTLNTTDFKFGVNKLQRGVAGALKIMCSSCILNLRNLKFGLNSLY